MVRLIVFGFLILTVIYVCLFFYSRSVRKSKLREWYQDSDKSMDEDTFVDEGLKEYDTSIRPKLLLGVYIVPIVTICVIIYLTNFA